MHGTSLPVASTAVDWERRRTELRWHLAAARQSAKARWVLRGARRIGKSAHVLGRPTVDATDLEVGDHFRVWSGHRQTLISGWGRIRIGDRCFINCGTVIIAVDEIVIGDDVALANEVYVMDSNSHGVEGRPHVEAPVRIGDGTWVGNRAMILPGVTIGKRVLVAAGAVVTRDVPDEVMVAGNPARVVRSLSYPAGCRRAWHDAWCPCPKVAAVEDAEPAEGAGPVPSPSQQDDAASA
jgi:acetyltransferase-like isoleucine patch superfamily enzyme